MNVIISNDDIKKIAYTLLDLFIDAGLWDNMRIYFLNCAYCTKSVSGGSEKTFTRETESGNAGQIYIIENISPNDYFFCGDILSISCETIDFTDISRNSEVFEKMNSLVAPYSLFFDAGNAWNTSLYHI